jgi:hypothetical protein
LPGSSEPRKASSKLKYALAYNQRSIAYQRLAFYEEAARDFAKAKELNGR